MNHPLFQKSRCFIPLEMGMVLKFTAKHWKPLIFGFFKQISYRFLVLTRLSIHCWTMTKKKFSAVSWLDPQEIGEGTSWLDHEKPLAMDRSQTGPKIRPIYAG